MIRRLFTALGPKHDRALRRLLARFTVAAAIQGVAFVMLVPALRELLGDEPERAWPWVITLAVLWLGYAAVSYPATLAGYGTGAAMSRDLHHRIGDKVARLPLAWFTPTASADSGVWPRSASSTSWACPPTCCTSWSTPSSHPPWWCWQCSCSTGDLPCR